MSAGDSDLQKVNEENNEIFYIDYFYIDHYNSL
ncbi:hypothetical protein M2101_000820 [Parabacteroides sp. PM5-20]|nr:hypothetical protein [Parabacteroides sp. PM5-20]